MNDGKITISWDELKTRQVEQRIGAMNAVKRNREYAQLTDAPEPAAPAPIRNLFYNTVVYMTVFGFLGGFLAWGCWTLLHFKGSVRNEAFVQMERVREIRENVKLSPEEKAFIVEQLARDGRNNPYFIIYSDATLTNEQKTAMTARVEARDRRKEFISNVLAYGVTGMLIAILLSIAEPAVSRNVPSAIINGSVGATTGLVGGICVALFVERMYKALGGQDGLITSGQQILARVAQWAVVGLFLTIGPGLVMRSFKKLIIGAAGGVLGGIAGGLLFDPIGSLTHSEDLSRLVGLVAIGAVAGLAVGLIENAAKSGWLKVTAGLIAGKQFILYRNPTFIGSSPDNQIYLFKDTNVGRRHAAIHIVRGGFEIEDLPLGVATLINGRPITRMRLRSGDQLQIGATRFVFQEKQPSNLVSQNSLAHDDPGGENIFSDTVETDDGTLLRECGICQSSIYTAEKTTTCPKCGLVFHAECWQENMGCAAYGCDQVNALAPKEEQKAPEAMPQPIVEAIEPLPWSFVLLGAAALSLLISAITYGIPSAIITGAAGWRLLKKRHLHDRPLLWALILAVTGVLLGIVISPMWWARDYTK